jgi:3-dehydroquinate synthase class II
MAGVSKLSDRIRLASKTTHAPMGFAAAARAPVSTLLCIVRLPANDVNKAVEAAERGADAVIIDGTNEGKLKDQASKAQGLVFGVSTEETERKQIAALRQAGADFVVLNIQSALAEALLEEKIGFVLNIERELDDTRLRTLGSLGLDALVVPSPGEPLTLERLLELRRIATLTRAPLLTQVAADAAVGYLQALRESGVAGVIVDASSLGRLGRLRETIAALPARGRERQEHAEATLSTPVLVGASSDDFDDDDD